jgi:hypothetical protein
MLKRPDLAWNSETVEVSALPLRSRNLLAMSSAATTDTSATDFFGFNVFWLLKATSVAYTTSDKKCTCFGSNRRLFKALLHFSG